MQKLSGSQKFSFEYLDLDIKPLKGTNDINIPHPENGSLVFLPATSSAVQQKWLLVVLGEPEDHLKTLAALDSSITVKVDHVNCGLWDQNMPIFFYMRSPSNVEELAENVYFRRHSNIRILSPYYTKDKVYQAQFNVWTHKWEYSLENVRNSNQMLVPRPSFDFQNYQVILIIG